jgi:hypothetical protein
VRERPGSGERAVYNHNISDCRFATLRVTRNAQVLAAERLGRVLFPPTTSRAISFRQVFRRSAKRAGLSVSQRQRTVRATQHANHAQTSVEASRSVGPVKHRE